MRSRRRGVVGVLSLGGAEVFIERSFRPLVNEHGVILEPRPTGGNDHDDRHADRPRQSGGLLHVKMLFTIRWLERPPFVRWALLTWATKPGRGGPRPASTSRYRNLGWLPNRWTTLPTRIGAAGRLHGCGSVRARPSGGRNRRGASRRRSCGGGRDRVRAASNRPLPKP